MDDLHQDFPVSINSNFGIAEDSDSHRSSRSPEHLSDSTSEEAASKKKKAPAPSWAPGALLPESPSNGSLTPTSTISSSSKYDPKALLNPKSNDLPRRNKRDTPSEEDSNLGDDDDTSGLGMSSMLSQVHRLKSRENAPNKRRKVDDLGAGEDEAHSKRTSARVDTGGQMGHALKEEQRRLQESQPVQSSLMVDLTGTSCFQELRNLFFANA